MSDVGVIIGYWWAGGSTGQCGEGLLSVGVALNCVMVGFQVFIALGIVTGSTLHSWPHHLYSHARDFSRIEGALLLWEDPGIFNSWSQVSWQQTNKSLAQHSTQASLIGVPSGRFLHLWQPLRFEPCAPTFLWPLVQRLPADFSVMEASCQWETRTTLSTITECRQDAPHWTT